MATQSKIVHVNPETGEVIEQDYISGAALVAEGLLDNQGDYVVPVGVITMTYSAGILATKFWTDGTYTWTITYGNDGTNITSISKPARTG